jgi:hypothetical protein
MVEGSLATLFGPEARFPGLPPAGFELFDLPQREERRRAILETIHPALDELGQDLLERLNPIATNSLHFHLPRLDWPRGYQPFCTWLALSTEAQGYQRHAQLNVGVHRDHVALRLGWDCAADGFGRFEFLGLYGPLRSTMVELAGQLGLRFQVYAAAPWPQGSRRIFSSETDVVGSFQQATRHGVWWELGRRHDLPEAHGHVTSPALGSEVGELFQALLPVYERIAGEMRSGDSES